MKENLIRYIDEHIEEFAYYVNFLYEHPEVGNAEFQAMSVLSEALCANGFDVTKEYIVPTGFIGIHKSKKAGPNDDCVINYTLANALKEEFHALGRNDVKPIDEVPCGSSDIGSVSYCCPTLHGYIKIADADVQGHSLEMAHATISKAGTKALRDGSIALATLGRRLIVDRDLLNRTKTEFSNARKKRDDRFIGI